ASHLDGPAAAILGDADVATALADAGPEALRALVKGDAAGALQHLAGNAELRDAVIDAAMADPDSGFAETVAAFGLTADDLKSAGEGLPDLMEAVGLAATAQTPAEWQAAALALVDAAEHAPELVAKGIEALASHLPEPAASIIGDEAVAQQLAEASPDVLRALLN